MFKPEEYDAVRNVLETSRDKFNPDVTLKLRIREPIDIYVFNNMNYIDAFKIIDNIYNCLNTVPQGYVSIKDSVINNMFKPIFARQNILLVCRQISIPMAILLVPTPYDANQCQLHIAIPNGCNITEQSKEFILIGLGIEYFSKI